MSVVQREELGNGEVEHAEAIKRLPSVLLAQPLRDCVFLKFSNSRSRVGVLLAEPVFAGLRVVLAVDVPAADVRQVVLEVELWESRRSKRRPFTPFGW